MFLLAGEFLYANKMLEKQNGPPKLCSHPNASTYTTPTILLYIRARMMYRVAHMVSPFG